MDGVEEIGWQQRCMDGVEEIGWRQRYVDGVEESWGEARVG
jgi:hypothetical protein